MINNRKGLDKAVDVEYQELDNRLKNKFIFNKEVIVEDLDVVLNGYLEELQVVINSLLEPDSIFYGMSLSAISAKYHEIIVNTGDLPKEDMLKYLAEVQELYAKIDPNYKTYVRGK